MNICETFLENAVLISNKNQTCLWGNSYKIKHLFSIMLNKWNRLNISSRVFDADYFKKEWKLPWLELK